MLSGQSNPSATSPLARYRSQSPSSSVSASTATTWAHPSKHPDIPKLRPASTSINGTGTDFGTRSRTASTSAPPSTSPFSSSATLVDSFADFPIDHLPPPRRASLLMPDLHFNNDDDLDTAELPLVMGLNSRTYPPPSTLSSSTASSEIDLDYPPPLAPDTLSFDGQNSPLRNPPTPTPRPSPAAAHALPTRSGLPTPPSATNAPGNQQQQQRSVTPGLGSAHSVHSTSSHHRSHMHYIGASPLVVSDDDDNNNNNNHTPGVRDSFFSRGGGAAQNLPASATIAHAGPTLDEAAAQEAAQVLKAAYVEGRIGSLAWRKSQVRAVGHAISIHRDRWMEALILDGHCSREALFEIKTAETQVARIMDEMDAWVDKQHLETGFVYSPTIATLAAPRGIVQILSSCEYPLMHALVPLAAALAAGNAVMLCPNPRSPALHALLRQLLPLTLDDNGTAIQDSIFYVSPLVDFVWSADIWNPEPCLKAGGMGIASKHDPVLKSPCIVDDPDIVPLAAKRIVEAAFTSAGMWPYKPSYVITVPKLKAQMVEELCKAIDDMFVTNPFFKDEYSRLPDPLVLDQVKALLIDHTDLVAHSRLEVDGGAGESSMTLTTPQAVNGTADLADVDDFDDDATFHSPLLAHHPSPVHAPAPAHAHDASRPTPRVRKPHRPPRGGVVAGGRWHDDSLVVHPTVVVCDAASPLLTEPGQGPILPVLALSKREMLAFVRVRQPFGVLYHFTRKRDKFAPQFARAVVINDTLSPFRVNDLVAGTLAAGAPAARALFDLFSVAQPQVFAPRNALAQQSDQRARYPPTTRGKLGRLERDLGWRTIPVPKAPWRERVADWVGAKVPGLVQAVAVGSTLACVVLVGVIAKERMGR